MTFRREMRSVIRAEMFGQLTTGLESAWTKLRGEGVFSISELNFQFKFHILSRSISNGFPWTDWPQHWLSQAWYILKKHFSEIWSNWLGIYYVVSHNPTIKFLLRSDFVSMFYFYLLLQTAFSVSWNKLSFLCFRGLEQGKHCWTYERH